MLLAPPFLVAGFVAGALVAPAAVSMEDPQVAAEALMQRYVAAWRDFRPSEAFGYGDVNAAAHFESFSDARVEGWLAQNRETVRSMQSLLKASGIRPSLRTDIQVQLAQAEDELATWDEDAPLSRQPQWFAELVSQALTHLLVRDQLSAQQRSDAAVARLAGVAELCRSAVESLTGGNRLRTQRALRTLGGARAFYAGGLGELVADWPAASDGRAVSAAIGPAIEAIEALEAHLRDEILPIASSEVSIGAQAYAAKLARRTGGLYDPQRLLLAATDEVSSVRELMIAEAERWRNSLGEAAPDASEEALLALAIEAMEADRQDNAADFLASFSELTFAAERFVEENGIATVPKPTTLIVALSPAHFSGAAVGGVYPSGPFDPSADTLFYVPSIPDSAPLEAREGFYRSFNTHFNTMIMSHEMFPGHYLQYKVAVSEAPLVRALFSNGSYVEGWGSFVEELMLNAGWAGNAPLTRLAHLRKRLENATRAYVSVQVSTAGWGEAEVLAFARDEGLLAPQFAQNLWQRVVNSPLQITDYMTGYLHFRRLHADYLDSADSADSVSAKRWVDAVLRAGPLPMALLDVELKRTLGAD